MRDIQDIYLLGFSILLSSFCIYKFYTYVLLITKNKIRKGKVIGVKAAKDKNGYFKFNYEIRIVSDELIPGYLFYTKKFEDPYQYKQGQCINFFPSKKEDYNAVIIQWYGFLDKIFLFLIGSITGLYFIISKDYREWDVSKSLILLIFCMVIYILSYKLYERVRSIRLLKKNGVITKGRIISLEKERDLDSRIVHCPLIQFEINENKSIIFKPKYYTSSLKDIGKDLSIIYDTNFPAYAEVYSKVHLYIELLLMVIFVFFASFSFIYIIVNL